MTASKNRFDRVPLPKDWQMCWELLNCACLTQVRMVDRAV
jgi:hypothetical protein